MSRALKGKLLLGWMPKDEALKFLLERCIFQQPMSISVATELWEQYRQKVAALPARGTVLPTELELTNREKDHIKQFRAKVQTSDKIHDVLKLDPSDLVLHQFYVITDRSAEYAERMMASDWKRMKLCLGMEKNPVDVIVTGGKAVLKLPHWEYPKINVQALTGGKKLVKAQEAPRYISVVKKADRMLLWAGYHRCYALLPQSNPDGLECPPLVTSITSSDVTRFFSPGSTRAEVRDAVLGERPALLRDFLDVNLVIDVLFIRRNLILEVDLVTGKVKDISVDET